jgi:hypothetical protein
MKKKKNRGDRINDAEVASRVDRVAGLLLDGRTTRQIVSLCVNEFGSHPRTIKRYIAEANDKIASEFDANRGAEVAKAVERLMRMQQECLVREDFRTAATIEAQLAKIHGTERQQQVEVTHALSDPIVMLMDQVRKGREALAAPGQVLQLEVAR